MSPFLDWAITAVFYIAVHQVERYAYEKARQHFRTHFTRQKFMLADRALQPIWDPYRELKTRSEDARYETKAVRAEDVRITCDLLSQIEKHIDSLLA
jgi:hypothetical protein